MATIILCFFSFIVLLLIAFPVLANIHVKRYSKTRICGNKNDIEHAQVALLLGAKVFENSMVSQEVYDRIVKTVELYSAGKIDKIIISGDHGTEEYDEVNTIKSWLMKFPVDENDIFMDHAGFSTYESIYRAKEIFGVQSMVIVTQKFHLPRAVFIAGKMGISCRGAIADRPEYRQEAGDSAREFFARTKDVFYTQVLKPKPKYLGRPISIHGSGLVTQD